MAFGNYAYNPYVNPWMGNYQPQQMQQPVQQMPQMQQQQIPQQPTQQGNGFVWVDGIDEANNFYVAPNNAVQLWDKNAPTIYKKSADSTGKPSMQIFDLVERKNETPAETHFNTDFSNFVTRDEFTRLEQKVNAMGQKNSKKTAKEADVNE